MNATIEKSIHSTHDFIKPILDKIGEPFKYKILESGFHGSCGWKLDNTGHLYIYPQNGLRGKLEDCIGFIPYTKWLPYADNIYHVTVERGVHANKNAAFLFSGLYNCKIIDAERLNVSETKNLTCMFEGCNNLKKVDLRGWKTSNVTEMGGMFNGCYKLEWIQGDFKNFDTSKVKDMNGMFYDCHSLELLNLNSFNIQNMCNMTNMFAYCTKLKVLHFEKFNKEEMLSAPETRNMFKGCRRLKRINPKPKPKFNWSFKIKWPENLNWKTIKESVKNKCISPLFAKIKKIFKKPSVQ